MQQRPAWKDDSRLASKWIPCHLRNPMFHYKCSQEPAAGLCPELDESVHNLKLYLRSILILSSNIPNDLIPSGFPNKNF
jgi:hypothetical protein